MNLLSKNSPVEQSISKMKAVLKDVGCEATFSQEKHPLKNCFSVNLASIEAPNHIYSNGKGVISDASIASAYGEYIERLQTNNFFIDFYLPNRKYYPDELAFDFGGDYLNPELKKIYSANGELEDKDLVDFNSDYMDKIIALPFIKQSTNEKTYIPINILSNLFVSNGLATGNTANEAKVQALSEIFERYVKIKIIKEGLSLPKFPNDVIKSFPKVYEDIQALRELGYKVEVFDASLGGVFPVTAISFINPKNSTLFVSFGSHPILEVSLERTMTELMQGRDLNNLDSFEIPTFDMELVSDYFNIEAHFIDSNGKMGFSFLSSKKSFEYSAWKYTGNGSEDEYAFLLDILKSVNKEMYLREYTYLDFYSCQMIIPNFSEVYPLDDMVYNNKNNGKLIRDMVLNFEKYDENEILDAIDSLDNSLNMQLYIGVIFEENFTMGDFKAQLLLLLGEIDDVIELLEFGNNKLGHLVAQLLRMQNDELDWEEYESALNDIYGEEKIKKAINIIEGNEFLINRTLHKDYYNMLSMFDKLEVKKRAFYKN
ncbi:YcaO-like family protein [Arcobacter aquimarinus]|uniref:YcaO-like family protein n=1 Tax=Arcobacter aquimarinus TaxID=1315211 RepID=UPI003BAF19DA